jgi:hypothetical protein
MSSMPRDALNTQGFEAGFDRRGQLCAQQLRSCDHFLRVGDVRGRDFVDDFRGREPEHALGADVDNLDDAFGVGGDARKIGAIENRPLQVGGDVEPFLRMGIPNRRRTSGIVRIETSVTRCVHLELMIGGKLASTALGVRSLDRG